MKKRSEKSKVCYLVTVGFVLYTLLIAILLPIEGHEMGYCILNYYIMFPIVSFICGLILGADSSRYKWSYLLFVGVMGILMPVPIFHDVWWGMGIFGMAPVLIGLIIGRGVKKMMKNVGEYKPVRNVDNTRGSKI